MLNEICRYWERHTICTLQAGAYVCIITMTFIPSLLRGRFALSGVQTWTSATVVPVGLAVLSAWLGAVWRVLVCSNMNSIKKQINRYVVGLVHDQLVDKPNLLIHFFYYYYYYYWVTDSVLSGVPKASQGKVVDFVCAPGKCLHLDAKWWLVVF